MYLFTVLDELRSRYSEFADDDSQVIYDVDEERAMARELEEQGIIISQDQFMKRDKKKSDLEMLSGVDLSRKEKLITKIIRLQ